MSFIHGCGQSCGERGALRLPGWLILGVLYIVCGIGFGFVRAAIGLGLGLIVLWIGLSYFRAVGEEPPASDAEPTTGDMKYVCKVCGLELRVEVATTDKAPSHCREPMVPVTQSGLRPL